MNPRGRILMVNNLIGSNALQLAPGSSDEEYRFSAHPAVSPYSIMMETPSSLISTVTTTDFECDIPQVDYTSAFSMFSDDVLPPLNDFMLNGDLPYATGETFELNLVAPFIIHDVSNSTSASMNAVKLPSAVGGYGYELAFGTVGGSGLGIDIVLPFSRVLVGTESVTLTLIFKNSNGSSSHSVSASTSTAGDDSITWSANENNASSWTYVKVVLEYTIAQPLSIVPGIAGHKFRLRLEGDGSDYKELTYAPRYSAFGPTRAELRQLSELVGTDKHTLAGLCLWVVTRPSATDSSTITMGCLTPGESGAPFLDRESILRYGTQGAVRMGEGRLGAIGIAFPLDMATYLDPDANVQTLRNIFAALSFSSSSTLRVDLQWGMCIASVVQNVWLPRPRLALEDKSIPAIFGLCSVMDSVYENKFHVRDIRKNLAKAWKFANSKKVRDMAATAWKYGKPIGESLLTAAPLLL